jgi:VIT1/CCC1 family predicted Fe2+/Mn2+ transporter
MALRLGANDGILSAASLVLGAAAARRHSARESANGNG